MGDLLPGLRYEEFLQASRACSTEAEFRATPFYSRHGAGLERLLLEPHVEPAATWAGQLGTGGEEDSSILPASPVRSTGGEGPEVTDTFDPPSHDILRVVQWNIEKGKELSGLARAIRSMPRLHGAHILCLNEVDRGMARSGGNADVARDLAEAAACGFAYVPTYIECTKGAGDDLEAPGTNALGLHGLAVLSRLPILRAAAAPLPACFDYFGFEEKRYGGRRVLMVLVEWNSAPVLVATAHLEVRNTRACRARQMRAALDAVAVAGREWGAVARIFTGDWNTHTFDRGGLLRAARGCIRIAGTRPEALEAQLLNPVELEPLFSLVASAGLEVGPFNDGAPTAHETLGRVEEWGSLPPPIGTMIRRLIPVAGRTLPLRLDWISAMGARAASPPWTLQVHGRSGRPLSDHAAIGADLSLIQPGRSARP